MQNQEIQIYKSGTHNLLDEEMIPKDAASASSNWYTQDGRIKLIPGKVVIGAAGTTGNVTGQIFGYKVDGTKVHWRKIGTKIQYLNGTTWTDVITGLTATADYAFSNYSSLAGSFTFAFGIDGIYKMHNAVPGSYSSLYDSAKNFKGKAFIDKGRAILWDRVEDKTGIYGSWVDNQQAVSGSTGVYTSVTGEATTSLTGTLAFKAGGATRNAFAVRLTITASGEVYTDNYLGVLTGSLGGTGTINYITGAYTVSNAGVGTVNYQWEDPNTRGVTDFSKSATRLAGEGFQFPQDEGGDAILNVLIGPDLAYYSMKSQSAYRLAISDDDLSADNNVFRKEIGVQSYRGSVSTGKGIVFINTANPEKPELTILQKNPVGDNVEPFVLFPHFKFSNYTYSDATVDVYERYILLACKGANATNNDKILLCDQSNNTVDETTYSARTFARSAGSLYMGSSVAQSVYELYNGFDDDGFNIDNYWTGKGETWGSNRLKKYRKIRLKGSISADQSYAVYLNYDDNGDQLVGTVLGSGSYVDYSSPQSIGSNTIGDAQIGGDDLLNVFPYFIEIRLKKVPKFRKRKITFIALGLGYVDIDSQLDWDINTYQDKIPVRFRQKQNVSLDGTEVDVDNPEF